MQAIILAGGFGTRLKSAIGEEIPKPMAPIDDEPFLAHFMRYLKQQGVTHLLLSLHHLPDSIRDYFGDEFEGMPLEYLVEDTPLGTGGAVKLALAHLQPQDPVVVTNGDSFIELDLKAMMAAHKQSDATLTIALCEMQDCSRYGQVMIDEAKYITSFVYPGNAEPGWISTGAYIVSPEIFDGYDLPEAFSFEADFQRPFTGSVRPYAWLTNGYFIDIGVPTDYVRAKTEFKQRIGI